MVFSPVRHARVLNVAWSPDGEELAIVVHSYTKTAPDTPYYVPDDKTDHSLQLRVVARSELPTSGTVQWSSLGNTVADIDEDEGIAGTDQYGPAYWFGERNTFIGADLRGPYVWRMGAAKRYLPKPSPQEFEPLTDDIGGGILAESYGYLSQSVAAHPDGRYVAVIWNASYIAGSSPFDPIFDNTVVAMYEIDLHGAATRIALERVSETSKDAGDGIPLEVGNYSFFPYDVENAAAYRLAWNVHPISSSVEGVYIVDDIPGTGFSWFMPLPGQASSIPRHGEFVQVVPHRLLPGPSGRISQQGIATDIVIPMVDSEFGSIESDETVLKLRSVSGWSPWVMGNFESL